MLAMFTTFLDFFGDPNRGADRIGDVGRREVGIGDRFLGPGEARTIMIVSADPRLCPGALPRRLRLLDLIRLARPHAQNPNLTQVALVPTLKTLKTRF